MSENLFKKSLGIASLLFTFLAFLIGGILLIIWTEGATRIIRISIAVVFLVSVFFEILNIINKRDKIDIGGIIASILVKIAVAYVVISRPALFATFIPVIFGIWAVFIGIIRIIAYFQYRKLQVSSRVFTFLGALISFGVGIFLLLNPAMKIYIILDVVGVYFVLYAFIHLGDLLRLVVPQKYRDDFKRKIRLPIPILWTAFIPRRAVESFNKLVDTGGNISEIEYSEKTEDPNINMEIFVHGGKSGTVQFGHVDIYFDGKIISFGSYDEASQRLHAMLGDGVLFYVREKDEYLKFCIRNNQKTIVGFGVELSEKQVQKVRKELKNIRKHTLTWRCDSQLSEDRGGDGGDYDDYASKLYRSTGAEFFKFTRGQFKGYFVMGTNCVLLADKLIGAMGGDIISLNGIITPGAYFNYLDREFLNKNGIVQTRTVYSDKYFDI